MSSEFFFFFNDTATTEIYTLSLHDALPISLRCGRAFGIDLYGVDIIESEGMPYVVDMCSIPGFKGVPDAPRSEEHTSELQSLAYLVCRLLLEKKKITSRVLVAFI